MQRDFMVRWCEWMHKNIHSHTFIQSNNGGVDVMYANAATDLTNSQQSCTVHNTSRKGLVLVMRWWYCGESVGNIAMKRTKLNLYTHGRYNKLTKV